MRDAALKDRRVPSHCSSAAEPQRLRRRYTENADAYAAYVEGRAELLRYTPEGARAAVAACERAPALDPGTHSRAGFAMAGADLPTVRA